MKIRSLIAIVCILSLALPMLLCGCKDKNTDTNSKDSFVYSNPPDYGTEGTPDEDGIIMGEQEEGESLVPPSLTAPVNP